MYTKTILLTLLIPVISKSIYCQEKTDSLTKTKEEKEIIYIRLVMNQTSDSLAKYAFMKMVSGTNEAANLASNFSIVPTDSKFTISGNHFFSTKSSITKKTTQNLALGINMSGSLTDKSIASIFEGGTFNSGIDLGATFSWRIPGTRPGRYLSEIQKMQEEEAVVLIQEKERLDSLQIALSLLKFKIDKNRFDIINTNKNIFDLNQQIRVTDPSIYNDSSSKYEKSISKLLGLNEELLKEKKKLDLLTKDSIYLDELFELYNKLPVTADMQDIDTLIKLTRKYGLVGNVPYADQVNKQIQKETQKKIYSIRTANDLKGLNISWLTAIFNLNKNTYRTYYDSLSYQDAYKKLYFTGFTLGVQANHYIFTAPVQQAQLLTIAVLYKHTNNLSDLTTSKLQIGKDTVNQPEVRRSFKEYDVYTDNVETYHTIQTPIHYYRFWGENLRWGFHLFGTADFRTTKDNVFDIGSGFILGLHNSKEKRLVNVEIYGKLRDITRSITLKEDSGWKQFQFGLSFAVPFLLFK